jgi:hypothetical protein
LNPHIRVVSNETHFSETENLGYLFPQYCNLSPHPATYIIWQKGEKEAPHLRTTLTPHQKRRKQKENKKSQKALYQKCVPDSFNSRSMVGFANTTKKRSVNRYNPPAHHKNPRLSFVVNRLQGSPPPPPQFPVSETEILRTEDSDPQQSSRDAIP